MRRREFYDIPGVVTVGFKWSIGYGQSHEKVGNISRPEPILLRWSAHDGTACGSVLYQRDPNHRHEFFILRIRVSRWLLLWCSILILLLFVIVEYVFFFFMCSYPIDYFISSCPYLSYRVTPVIPIIAGVLFLFVVGSLFKTSFTDPGIIPRATDDEAAFIEKQVCKWHAI